MSSKRKQFLNFFQNIYDCSNFSRCKCNKLEDKDLIKFRLLFQKSDNKLQRTHSACLDQNAEDNNFSHLKNKKGSRFSNECFEFSPQTIDKQKNKQNKNFSKHSNELEENKAFLGDSRDDADVDRNSNGITSNIENVIESKFGDKNKNIEEIMRNSDYNFFAKFYINLMIMLKIKIPRRILFFGVNFFDIDIPHFLFSNKTTIQLLGEFFSTIDLKKIIKKASELINPISPFEKSKIILIYLLNFLKKIDFNFFPLKSPANSKLSVHLHGNVLKIIKLNTKHSFKEKFSINLSTPLFNLTAILTVHLILLNSDLQTTIKPNNFHISFKNKNLKCDPDKKIAMARTLTFNQENFECYPDPSYIDKSILLSENGEEKSKSEKSRMNNVDTLKIENSSFLTKNEEIINNEKSNFLINSETLKIENKNDNPNFLMNHNLESFKIISFPKIHFFFGNGKKTIEFSDSLKFVLHNWISAEICFDEGFSFEGESRRGDEKRRFRGDVLEVMEGRKRKKSWVFGSLEKGVWIDGVEEWNFKNV